MIKQPLSELLIETIATARAGGGELVRLPVVRGCWTLRDSVPSQGWPAWWVTDNTVRALLKRDIAVVTRTRDEGRPAAVRVMSAEEIAPKPQVVELTNRVAIVRLFDRDQNSLVDVKVTAGECKGVGWTFDFLPSGAMSSKRHGAA